MHVFIDERTPLIEPFATAPRWRWSRRRIRSHLRRFGRGAASSVTGVCTGLIGALQQSRSRSAARLINQHRHLIDDGYHAHHASLETPPSGPVQP